MDFRLIDISKIRRFPTADDGLRVISEKAPRAEALAISIAERCRPAFARVYALRRRTATIVIALLAAFLFAHVTFGANGMIVYKQKRTEYESLQKRIAAEQKENDLYAQQIRALQTDEKAIEKEAREQMRYARPGEIVYVPQTPSSPQPPTTHSAKK
jgi:cell division protein FtsB